MHGDHLPLHKIDLCLSHLNSCVLQLVLGSVALQPHPLILHPSSSCSSSCCWCGCVVTCLCVKVSLTPRHNHFASGFFGPFPYALVCVFLTLLSCFHICSLVVPSCWPCSDIISSAALFRFLRCTCVEDTSSSGFGFGPFRRVADLWQLLSHGAPPGGV